jgi:hypothetical protein
MIDLGLENITKKTGLTTWGSGLRPQQGVHYGIYRDPIRGWFPILQKTLAHKKMGKKWGKRQYMMF